MSSYPQYIIHYHRQNTVYVLYLFRLPYKTLFGGAEALTSKQFVKMNGFSNDYWGWGGEDDDISSRY